MQYMFYGRAAARSMLLSWKFYAMAIPLYLLVSSLLREPITGDMMMELTLFGFFTFFFSLIMVSGFVSGWKIDGESIQIKAWGASSKYRVAALQVGIIEDISQLKTIVYGSGIGFPGVLVVGSVWGSNKKSVVILQYLGYKRFVVIETGATTYLIAHPGVEKLYTELVRLGATQTSASELVQL